VRSTTVFQRVVKQASDGLVLVATKLDHQPGHAQQVVEIGDVGALAHLRGMGDARVVHGPAETIGKYGHARFLCDSTAPRMP
jgi:hypothetical protein